MNKILIVVLFVTILSYVQSQTFRIEEYFGVSQDWQPVEFSYNGTTTGKLMIGPNGQEVAFQQLSSSILIRTRLPASSVSRIWKASQGFNASSDTWTCDSNLCPRDGEVVQIKLVSGSLPSPLTEGLNYFAGSYGSSSSYRFYSNKARTQQVSWSSATSGNFLVVSNGWITDPDDSSFDTLYCLQHSYQTGDPISIRCIYGNVLPSPLTCNSVYYVIRTGTSSLKLATSYNNAINKVAIDITQSSASGNPAKTVSELVVSWNWTLTSGTPSASVSNAVTLQDAGNYYEVKNGLTGFRMLKPQGNPSKSKVPLNGILLADNTTWVAKDTVYFMSTNTSAFTGYSVSIEDNGALKTTIKATYTADVIGYVTQTVTLYAGHKSIVIEDDQQFMATYFLDFYSTGVFDPNLLRYRGTSADSTACGYQYATNGTQILATNSTQDVLIDVGYYPRYPEYGCTLSDFDYTATFAGAINWDLSNSASSSGWYYMLYNNASSANGNMVGIYLGRGSRTLAANGVWLGPWTDYGPNVGWSWYPILTGSVRREWAIYVSTKEEVPSSLSSTPSIALERNKLAGMSLTKLAAMDMTFSDPPAGWLPYKGQDEDVWNRLIKDIAAVDASFYTYIYNVSTDDRDLLTLVKINNSLAIDLVMSQLQTTAHKLVNVFSESGGFDPNWTYSTVASYWIKNMWRIPVSLGNSWINATQQTRWRAIASFFCNTVWNEEFVPFGVNTTQTLNAIQSQTYSAARALSSFTFTNQSLMNYVNGPATNYVKNLFSLISDDGVPKASTWYIQNSTEPIVSAILDMEANGQDTSWANWEQHTRFLLQILTPPEPRFGKNRKVLSLGDGNTYSSALHGALATALKTSSPESSKNLQWAWEAQGGSYRSNAMSNLMVIDRNHEGVKPELGSEHFPGYMSVLRHGFDTPHETVAWFINGNWYQDGRHEDSGQISIYAHNAPLSIDWNANVNNPRVNGGYMHSRVVLDQYSGIKWDADRPSISQGATTFQTFSSAFSSFSYSTSATSKFSISSSDFWIRSVVMVATNPAFPVIMVKDYTTGVYQSSSRVVTWNFMATGDVSTTSGAIDPIPRAWPDLPSAGIKYTQYDGFFSFQYTGQTWPAHPKGGIDWYMYVYAPSSSSVEYLTGSWGHSEHSDAEKTEYLNINGVPFAEKQYITRIRATAPLYSVIIPYEKGSSWTGQVLFNATSPCNGFTFGTEITCLSEDGYTFQNTSMKIFTTFGSKKMYFDSNNTIIEGGPAEVIYYSTSEATIRISGTKGLRNFTLTNGPWYGPGLSSVDTNSYQVDFQQDTPLTLSVSKTATPSPTPSITPTVTPSKSATPSLTPSPSKSPVHHHGNTIDSTTAIIIAIAVGGGGLLVIILIIVILLCVCRKKDDDKEQPTPMKLDRFVDSSNPQNYDNLPQSLEMQIMGSAERMALIQNWNINYNEIIIEKQIGKGAYGVVYKGAWKGIEVAVKQMLSDDNKTPIKEFLAEAELMTQLRYHPNITQILGMCASPPCLVTEFVHNGSLAEWLKDYKLQKEEMVIIARGIAKGMLYLHSEGVIHRDLAARNILLDKNLNPKVSDFGMSRVVMDNKTNKTVQDIGPIRWMAPEALRRRVYNAKTDVWSFGVVLYEIMTRKMPYSDCDLMQVAATVTIGEMSLVPEIEQNADKYPPVLVQVFMACLNVNPDERPTFEQIMSTLNNN